MKLKDDKKMKEQLQSYWNCSFIESQGGTLQLYGPVIPVTDIISQLMTVNLILGWLFFYLAA
jgi:hypothetical protein